MSHKNRSLDTLVIGGGLAGLTAGVILARGGQRVAVLEKGREAGGRAQSQTRRGFQFNLGPHALYRGGKAAEVLRSLGIPFHGSVPSGGYGLARGSLHALPANTWSLLTTTLLSPREKFELVQFWPQLANADPRTLETRSVREWLDAAVRTPGVRQLIEALIRVATYSGDLDRLNAGAALQQVQIALRSGVWYLDGGWQMLVDGLRDAFERSGGELECGSRAARVESNRDHVTVHLADGSALDAGNVVIAASPEVVAELVSQAEPGFLARLSTLRPVVAATLDLALSELPAPRQTFALGIDAPFYFSVHSAWARLTAAGGALIHAAKYLSDPILEPAAVRAELESLLDRVQPGWRRFLIDERFLPHVVVTNMLVTREEHGLAGRPGVELPGEHGIYLAGDWIGDEGMLADASLASAGRAANLILARTARHDNEPRLAAPARWPASEPLLSTN